MNRPKKEDTLTGRMYREALERYCDELEKALDKACWCITHNIDFLTEVDKTEVEWKQWFSESWY